MGKLKGEPLFALEERGFYGLTGPYAKLQDVIERGAEAECLTPLSEQHWRVIQFVLDYHFEHHHPPVAVRIGRATGLGARRLRELFPAGVVLSVFRMAELELPHDLAGPAEPAMPN